MIVVRKSVIFSLSVIIIKRLLFGRHFRINGVAVAKYRINNVRNFEKLVVTHPFVIVNVFYKEYFAFCCVYFIQVGTSAVVFVKNSYIHARLPRFKRFVFVFCLETFFYFRYPFLTETAVIVGYIQNAFIAGIVVDFMFYACRCTHTACDNKSAQHDP